MKTLDINKVITWSAVAVGAAVVALIVYNIAVHGLTNNVLL